MTNYSDEPGLIAGVPELLLFQRAQMRGPAWDKAAQECFRKLLMHFELPSKAVIHRFVADTEGVQDVFQEACLRIWIGLLQKPDAIPFRRWWFRICVNEAFRYYKTDRKHQHEPLFDDEEDEHGIYHAGHEALISANIDEHYWQTDLLNRALRQLSPKAQNCIFLYHRLGYSQVEIANMLGTNTKRVSECLNRAAARLLQVCPELREMIAVSKEKEDGRRSL